MGVGGVGGVAGVWFISDLDSGTFSPHPYPPPPTLLAVRRPPTTVPENQSGRTHRRRAIGTQAELQTETRQRRLAGGLTRVAGASRRCRHLPAARRTFPVGAQHSRGQRV